MLRKLLLLAALVLVWADEFEFESALDGACCSPSGDCGDSFECPSAFTFYESTSCSTNPCTVPPECQTDNDCGKCQTCDSGSCVDVPDACGNGILEAGEECEDGNTESGDGCSDSCQVELGPRWWDIANFVMAIVILVLLIGGMVWYCTRRTVRF